jgi:Domain of unknown function (DUF4112)
MARAITPYSGPEYQPEVLHPEVVDPRIADVEALARWLDYAFVMPGGFRYGLGGFIGLIPGLGDIFDALLSLYIVGRAVQLGIPRVTIARMVLNVGIESAAGSVPFLGAMFDTVFKANRRNYQLLRNHLSGARGQTMSDWVFLIATGVLLIASVAIPVIVLIELSKHL